jgi:hypothetical protein
MVWAFAETAATAASRSIASVKRRVRCMVPPRAICQLNERHKTLWERQAGKLLWDCANGSSRLERNPPSSRNQIERMGDW